LLRPNIEQAFACDISRFHYLASMQYAIIQSSKRLEINNERAQHIGIVEFDTWRPAKVHYTSADNSIYQTASVGFWGSKIAISKNGEAYAEIEMKMRKGFIISFINGPTYTFRKKGFWNASEYIVIDNADSPVATIRSYFRWKIFKYQHDIDINESMLSKEVNDVMPFLIVYCLRLLRVRQAAAGA